MYQKKIFKFRNSKQPPKYNLQVRYAKLVPNLLVATTPRKINNLNKLKLQFSFLSLMVEIFPSFETYWY